jgi:hypothetical protein
MFCGIESLLFTRISCLKWFKEIAGQKNKQRLRGSCVIRQLQLMSN